MHSARSEVIDTPFHVDRPKSGRAICKKCRQQISFRELRFAKLGPSPLEGEMIKYWYHISCMFDLYKKQGPTSKKIERPEDIGGWSLLSREEQMEVVSYFPPDLKQIFANYFRLSESGEQPLLAEAKNCADSKGNVSASCLPKFKPTCIGNNLKKEVQINLKLMVPILPVLAEPCKSLEMALKKYPNGILSELMHDGERVQLHKEGNDLKYFTGSLKELLPHKVNHFKEYIPVAFPHAKNFILDAEILIVDNNGQPLPYASLGIDNENAFNEANVCLIVLDCIYFNGESLIKMPLRKRKEILEHNMIEIKNRIMLSEYQLINNADDLEGMVTKVFKLGLEGLVLKNPTSIYELGKQHWLKINKDCFLESAISDSPDLVVLGAWLGHGKEEDILSIFLMGCYDPSTNTWRTVAKVQIGHDDNTLKKLQAELKMTLVDGCMDKVPEWLKCTETMVPDFVAADPENMPVWEITGHGFTRNVVHTANGISIRFPRITKVRHDKDWRSATNLSQLQELYDASTKTKTTFPPETITMENVKPTKSDIKMKETLTEKKHTSSTTDSDSSPPKKAKSIEIQRNSDTETKQDCKPGKFPNAKIFMNPLAKVIVNPLPKIFNSCVIQMPKNYADNDHLRRYLLAYGAFLHDPNKNRKLENGKEKVTHVIHLNWKSPLTSEQHWAENVRHVHITWIWNSIKLLAKQDEKNYVIGCE